MGRISQGQNRTREIRPSGIAGGSWETWHQGETRNPHRVPKGRMRSLFASSARAPRFYPTSENLGREEISSEICCGGGSGRR